MHLSKKHFLDIFQYAHSSTTNMLRLRFKKRSTPMIVLILIISSTIYYSVFFNSLRNQIEWKEDELLDLTNFQYTVQPTDAICDSSFEELDAIILITSAWNNAKLRSHHRAGISNENLRKMKMVRVFLLGIDLTQSKFVTQKVIQTESKQFNDIVQGNFKDSYHNLTYKNVMGLRWSSSHPCLKSKYIFRADDDIIVDYFHLMHFLLKNHYNRLHSNKTEYFMAGLVNNGTAPLRSQSKWFVSTDEYAASFYPAYLAGWCVVTTQYTAKSLISHFDRTIPIYWMEDVWITGILREIKNIPLVNMLSGFFTYQFHFLECCLSDFYKYRYRCPILVGPNIGHEDFVEKYLKALHKQCYNMSSDIMTDYCIERDKKSLEKSCIDKKT